jgi:hypothetical protein
MEKKTMVVKVTGSQAVVLPGTLHTENASHLACKY